MCDDAKVAAGERGPKAQVLTFRDVASRLGVTVEDAHLLRQLGLLRPRDMWAVSTATFDEEAVEQCRAWLARQAQPAEFILAQLRAEHGAELLDPETLIRQEDVGIAFNLYGKISWQKAVARGLDNEIRDVQVTLGMEPLDDVQLLPPEWRRATNSFQLIPDMIQVGIFVGNAAGTWAVGEALARLAKAAGGAASRNGRYWKGGIPKGFWFVVSIWHSADQFWAVIALDVSPGDTASRTQLRPAYAAILRHRTKIRKAATSPAAERIGKEAVVAIVRQGQLSPRCWDSPTLEEALRSLGSVKVVSSGGLLEVMWATAHPRSSIGLRLCQTLQSNPGQFLLAKHIALQSRCSVSAVRSGMQDLIELGAPLRYEPGYGWMYDPTAVAVAGRPGS